jgi:biopolymer transport protein ExbD
MQVQEDNAIYSEINITPMLDVAYVLLIMFIILTTAAVQGIRVNLPQAANAPSLAKPQTKAITIAGDGQLYLDAFPVTLPELETMLGQHKAVVPEFPVIVRGDSAVQYGKVIEVLDLLGRLEITQLGLVTQRIVR